MATIIKQNKEVGIERNTATSVIAYAYNMIFEKSTDSLTTNQK